MTTQTARRSSGDPLFPKIAGQTSRLKWTRHRTTAIFSRRCRRLSRRSGREFGLGSDGLLVSRSSARCQSRRQRQHIVPDDQPTLAHRVGTGGSEVGHLLVTDLGLCEVVQGERSADPASLVVTGAANGSKTRPQHWRPARVGGGRVNRDGIGPRKIAGAAEAQESGTG